MSNLANIDTPGYHTRDIDFRREMKAGHCSGDQIGPVGRCGSLRTQSRKYASFTPLAHPVRGLMERPDGNNVSLERESLLLAETQLRFNLGVQLLRTNFNDLSAPSTKGPVMNLFGMLEVSGSALTAERQRAEVVTSNMANAETTRTPEGGPYRRQLVVFRAGHAAFPLLLAGQLRRTRGRARRGAGDQVVADPEPASALQPGIPTPTPRVCSLSAVIRWETTDLLGAVRAYELNASAVQSTKTMIQQSLDSS